LGSYLYTIEDAKGQQSTITIRVPEGIDHASVWMFAEAMRALITDLITGKLLSTTVGLTEPNMDAQAAASTSDVEEKAYFSFHTTNNQFMGLSIPTVDESIFTPMGKGWDIVDESNPAVAAFITAMVDGIWSDAGNIMVQPCDSRSYDLSEFYYGKAIWKPRKKKKIKLF